jgi:hypothetical protein
MGKTDINLFLKLYNEIQLNKCIKNWPKIIMLVEFHQYLRNNYEERFLNNFYLKLEMLVLFLR